jgi:hypothetical protein
MTRGAFAGLSELGTPERLEAAARDGRFASIRRKVNTHVHLPPNFSAFDSARHALELASVQQVQALGVSNYYDFDVYADLAAEAGPLRIFPLFGLEVIALLPDLAAAGTLVNDPGNPGKMYMCGKGIVDFEAMTPTAQGLMARIRQNDEMRMSRMVEETEEIFSAAGVHTGLTAGRIAEGIVRRYGVKSTAVCLQERHIAQAFQEALFRLSPPERRLQKLATIFGVQPKAKPEDHVRVQNEIRTHLMKTGKPAFIPESFVSISEARRLILELGGIPSYPTLADGTNPICAFEAHPQKLIDALFDHGVYCAEFIPTRNEPETLRNYVHSMRAAGLVITAGTEHNTLELLPIEPACAGGAPVPDKVRDIFWEGACVVAAHQFLRLHGRCGYVDGSGRLHSGFADREVRIDYFRRLGAAVMSRYIEQSFSR